MLAVSLAVAETPRPLHHFGSTANLFPKGLGCRKISPPPPNDERKHGNWIHTYFFLDSKECLPWVILIRVGGRMAGSADVTWSSFYSHLVSPPPPRPLKARVMPQCRRRWWWWGKQHAIRNNEDDERLKGVLRWEIHLSLWGESGSGGGGSQ